MLPGLAIVALVSSLMIVYLTDLHDFGYFLIAIFLVLLNAEVFMYMVSAITGDETTGTAIGAFFFGTFMICCGFLLSRDVGQSNRNKFTHYPIGCSNRASFVFQRMPKYWIWMYYGAFETYVLRAMIYGDLGSREFPSKADDPAGWKEGQEIRQVLELYDMEDVDVAVEFGILTGYFFLVFFIFTAIVQFKHTGRK